MFTKIFIDNFLGISSPIELNFIAKSRGKDNNNSVAKTVDGMYINKMIGIIGGNASGKTSILSALNIIGGLLVQPILQFNIEDKLKELEKLISDDTNPENRKIIHRVIEDYNSGIDIRFQNLKRKNDNSIFEIEMYIESENDELTGYYTYIIVLSGLEKCIKNEILRYRKTYKQKNKDIVNIVNSKEGQVYYINRYFKNITDINNEKKEQLEKKYKYINCFITHYIKNSATISTDSENNYKELKFIDWYKKNPDVFTTLARIVDTKICDVIVEKDARNEELLFVLRDGSKITRNMLSKGTDRFLNLIRYVNDIIEKNGVLIVDEIEQNLHKDLVGLIINMFSNNNNSNSQIIFTTLSPDIFDVLDENNKKVFKQDMIYILDSISNTIKIDKLMDLKIDGQRVKGDASVSNLYRDKKIARHPDVEQINLFLNNFKNRLL